MTPPGRSHLARVLLPLALASLPAFAALRAPYGGQARVVVSSARSGDAVPSTARSLAEVAVAELQFQSLCRLERGQLRPILAAELSRPSPTQVRIALPTGRARSEPLLTPKGVARAWERVAAAAPNPYRALLFPLKNEGRGLVSSPSSEETLDLELTFPWPDLEKSLCHPALAPTEERRRKLVGVGPFRPGAEPSEPFAFHPDFPAGRPYLDALSVAHGNDREAARLFAGQKAQLWLNAVDSGGAPSGAATPMLHATYLLFRSNRLGAGFRAQLQRVLDRSDLSQFFARGPSVPMTRLLPPALSGEEPLSKNAVTVAPAATAVTPHEAALLYDASNPDHRAVAERLQVKLHSLGYKVSLKAAGDGRARERWAAGEADLMLDSVLLPPAAAPALAIVLELAGRHDLLATQLPPLGAIAEPTAREARAREAADALAPQLELLPLFAQGLRVAAGPRLGGLAFDDFGLPILDGLYLLDD